ncbi:MAG: sigma 54-interacting transcriptional regulator [Candidatus Scalindua sp.]|nr:sigma 54-interacting transcriptional regulator [Candidatus Scalindua sp.]
MKKDDKKGFSDLRKEAKKRLGPESIPLEKLSDEEVRKLAHELQVHQIELDMQNEELRNAQMEIERSRDRYTFLYDHAPVGYFTISEKGSILEANLTGAAILGIERNFLIKEPVSKFIVSEDQDKFYHYRRSVYDGKETKACELKMVKKDGTVFHAQLECAEVHVADDISRQWRAVLTDITERKLAEEEVTSVSKFPSENPSPVFRIRNDGIIIYANDSSRHLLKDWSIRVGERIPDNLKQTFNSSYESQITKETEITSNFRVFSLLITPITGTNYVNVYGKDITERKLAENKIKRTLKEVQEFKENLEAIFKNIKDGIILLDSEQRVVELNNSARRICGLPDINKARGEKFETLTKKCEGECLQALLETLNTKLPAERSRFECSSCLVSVATSPISDIQGKFKGCIIVVRDETRLAVLEANLRERQQLHNIIGKSDGLRKVFSLIEILSETPTTVLITGENGTGKGLAAEALHYHQKGSKKKPFVVVSCSSLSDSLLESELFGHVKGAFTGALSDRVGRFQMAEGGTLFLDEIGDITHMMQLRLLRVLEEKVFERLGDSTTLKADVRVIAATNQDLRRKVSQGKFREDLYHRLKVVEITMPPLRERSEDIPLLVEYFIKKLNMRLHKNIESLSTTVLKRFMDYQWPGNIRQLYNTMEYAFITCDTSVITIDNLPSDFKNMRVRDRRSEETDKRNDRNQIIKALEKSGWNKAKAARLLGVHRVTIYKMMKKYSIKE